MRQKLLIVEVAALGSELLRTHGCEQIDGLRFAPASTVFPAVTSTVQASFRTASPPGEHGMIANGLYFRELRRPMFWEQSSALVTGERIWSAARRRGKRVGMLFWQQSMGEDVDVLLTPAPIHKHHGGMIQDCYARPDGLYQKLCAEVGSPFKLQQYWGPLASYKAGDWIAQATGRVLADEELGLDVCLTYLPTLDYDLQRAGPTGPKAAAALDKLTGQLAWLLETARESGWEVIVFGDYAIEPVTAAAAMPNLALHRAGRLLHTRQVRGRLYPDFHTSRAFAMVDHQVAHVYVGEDCDVPAAGEALAAAEGIAEVLGEDQQARLGLAHPRCGELVLLAEPGSWLAYPWWTDRRQAPDYASHVDIHNKPGYDPCELLFGWPPMSVSLDVTRIRGTHGRVGPGREIAWASTVELPGPTETLLDLARAARRLVDEEV